MKGYVVCFLIALSAQAATLVADASPTHPYHLPQADAAPAELHALIEIPDGSFVKYELDRESGHLIVDRFLHTPMAYPANYGSLPSLFAADGDPLDVLVFTRTPVIPGALIRVRPIGMLRMRDAGEADDKVIAVPADDVDAFFQHVRDITDLPVSARDGIEAFFRRYKSNDPDDDRVTTHGFINAEVTLTELKRYIQQTDREESN